MEFGFSSRLCGQTESSQVAEAPLLAHPASAPGSGTSHRLAIVTPEIAAWNLDVAQNFVFLSISENGFYLKFVLVDVLHEFLDL